MITVYESVARNWLTPILATIEPIHVVVDLEVIPDWAQFGNSGLFSSPNDQHFDMMGGLQRHVEFKSFYLRRSFSDFQQRLNNETFMETLRNKIHEMNLDSNFPDDGREWISITINAGIYPAQKEVGLRGDNADYLVPLRLEYVS